MLQLTIYSRKRNAKCIRGPLKQYSHVFFPQVTLKLEGTAAPSIQSTVWHKNVPFKLSNKGGWKGGGAKLDGDTRFWWPRRRMRIQKDFSHCQCYSWNRNWKIQRKWKSLTLSSTYRAVSQSFPPKVMCKLSRRGSRMRCSRGVLI